MGQAKYNPTAIAAKAGEIAPKPPKMGKREMDRFINTQVQAMLAEKSGFSPSSFISPYSYPG